jgi:hypothetical protein
MGLAPHHGGQWLKPLYWQFLHPCSLEKLVYSFLFKNVLIHFWFQGNTCFIERASILSSLLLKLLSGSVSNFPHLQLPLPGCLPPKYCNMVSLGILTFDCYSFSGPQDDSVSNHRPPLKTAPGYSSLRSGGWQNGFLLQCWSAMQESLSHQISMLDLTLW